MILGPPLPLSGSTNGRPIQVDHNMSPWVIIHTAAALTAGTEGPIDRVWLWASNPMTNARALVVGWGSETLTGARIVNGTSFAAASAPLLIADGFPLRAGLTISALTTNSAALLDGIVITGYYIRITP